MYLLIPPAIGGLATLIKDKSTNTLVLPGGIIKYTHNEDTSDNARTFSLILTFGLSEKLNHHTESYTYKFKDKTLGHNIGDAVLHANREGEVYLKEHKYEDSIEWFNAAYQACPSSDSKKQTFKDNINWAKAKIINEEGDKLFDQKKHAEATAQYEAAYNQCPSSKTYDRSKYLNNTAKSLDGQGLDLLDRRYYASALEKFSEALRKCTSDFSGKQTFQDNVHYAQAEVLNAEGNKLYHKKLYEEAVIKFQEAWNKCPSNRVVSLDIYNNNKANALHGKGLKAYEKGNYLEAANCFSRAYSECTSNFYKEQEFRHMRDKAIAKCTTEQKYRGNPEYTFIDAQYLIANGIPDVENPDEENTIIIGNTIGGKSTIINYLLSNPLTVAKINPDAKGRKGKELKIFAIDPEAGPEIGASGGSMTTIPKKWRKLDATYSKAIWDCPGFGDNRGPAIDISNACLLSKLLNNASNIRIVLVSDINDIKSDNPAGFVDLIKQVKCLFGDLDIIKSCTMLLVTKVDDYGVDDIVEDLKQIAQDVQDPDLDKEFIRYLAAPETIAIFTKPKKEGILDMEDAGVIAEAIDNIDSKHQLNVRVGISSDTKVFTLKNKSVLLDQLRECLKVLPTKLRSAFDVARINTTSELELIRHQLLEITQILHLHDHEANIKHLIKRIPKIFEGQKWWINYKNCITEKDIKALSDKLDLVCFVESICDQQMSQFDGFKTSLRDAYSELEEKIAFRIKELEPKISRTVARTHYK